MQLGRLGVWTWMDTFSAADAAAFAAQVEDWGYSALWIPEAVGRDPLVLHAHLAGATSKLILATGIANLYARDPMTMRAGRDTLAELSNGRFLLGLGVSHAPMVSGMRGHEYGKPIATMRAYLEAMEKALYLGPAPPETPPVVLAALRPKMLGLAAESAEGAHPYNVTPEHTARAREILGKDAWLCPEQKVMLETDASKARAVARQTFGPYVTLPNYQNNLKWLGFEDSDFQDGGSDRLLDALFAWGDERAIRQRIQAHWDAGADHVCIQPIRPDGEQGPDHQLLELLAPANA
ncbi:MAG: TIGR03620 family F420-dependent LLM class oxidoreductase [Deltaproteobacteria bacterium]|nr:TIGR03620 family F420-dependent LLM class oxidoreductase [Deltaproteobacteria bacterium]MBW2361328.1 TIGR03620 family F420-dependent LLM class oxidoreductase [Deltaproteobacteria bacterium]